jgi:hypothetical protein
MSHCEGHEEESVMHFIDSRKDLGGILIISLGGQKRSRLEIQISFNGL